MGQNDANDSPEKQLLKLIEAQGGGQARQAPAQASTSAPAAAPVARAPLPKAEIGSIARGTRETVFSLGALQGRWSFFSQGLSGFSNSFSGPLDLKKINTFLVMAAVFMGLYFSMTTAILAIKLSSVPSFSFKSDPSKPDTFKKSSRLKALAFYVERARARDIFKLGAKPSGETAAPNAAEIKAKQDSMIARYRLVGISWSDNPDVMLEDTSIKKTFFLKKDQSLDTVKVQAVFKDKVILSQDGIEVELR